MADPTAGDGRYTGAGQNLGNDITAITKFMTDQMDQIIAIEAKTNGMQANSAFVQNTTTAGVVKLATMETTGLGNYDKINGYPVGGVSLVWNEYTLQYDRAINATIDRRDQQTSGGLVTAAAALAETMRREVVPEIDATRIAKLYTELNRYNSANSNVVTGAAPTKANIMEKLTTAVNAIADTTGIEDGMTIYVNSSLRNVLDTAEGIVYNRDFGGTNNNANTAIRQFRGNTLNFVPAARMKTAITLKDGYTGALTDGTDLTSIDRTKYGYEPASGAKDIQFFITTPGVANAVTAINATKVITAEVNQRYDGDSFYFRLFHDLIVPKYSAPAAYMYVKSSS